MLFDQKSLVHREAVFWLWHTQTHTRATDGHCNLEAELAQRADSVRIKCQRNQLILHAFENPKCIQNFNTGYCNISWASQNKYVHNSLKRRRKTHDTM